MENLTNRNPIAYTGNEIRHRKNYDKNPDVLSKFVSIIDVKERAGGGLILYLRGSDGKAYDFELERVGSEKGEVVSKGESVRRQFLDDVGVCDIFDNIYDIDYRSLLGEKIEAFVNTKDNYVAAVSPIFRPLQNLPLNKQKRIKDLENLFCGMTRQLDNIASAVNIADYKNLEGTLILIHQKNSIQNSVRRALRLKREYMQLSSKETPYYEFINVAAIVLNKTNKKLEKLEPRSFEVGGGLEKIRDLKNSDFGEGNSTINDSLPEEKDKNLEDFLRPENPEDLENGQELDDNF